ncbi:MAG: KH domain-containing protein [Patescibacteria group bacterium]|nr:KH domain-containing protein [Patescibacteria group bacterium]
MKKALDYIVSNIVDEPKKVQINEEEKDGVITFTITVAKEDMGKVIGKNGKVIKAIRNVIKIPAIKQGKKIYISLAEEPQP